MNKNLSQSVLLITTNHEQLPLNIAAKHEIEKEFPDLRCLIVTRFITKDEKDLIYLYKDRNTGRPHAERVAQRIREEYDLEPAMLYKSELKYVRKSINEIDLITETYFTLSEANKLIIANNVCFVFMYGGGTMFTNCFFELASRYKAIKCYRMHPLHYFNTIPDTRRYFFADNNYQRLPDKRNVPFDTMRFEKCCEYARTYIDAVKTRLLIPDMEARLMARQGAFTPNLGQMVKSLALRLAMFILRRQAMIHKERINAYFRKLYLDLTRRKYRTYGDYFIYVLHHPYDSQLLYRGRCFTDQVALCRILASNLPSECQLLVKEHPVQPGMLPITDIRRLKRLYPNVVYVDYSIRFEDIVGNANGVITINSTAGLEAMIHGIPVIVLGEAFYRGQQLTYDIKYFAELTNVLKDILISPKIPTEEEIINLVARLIYETEPEPDVHGNDVSSYIVNGIIRRIKQDRFRHST